MIFYALLVIAALIPIVLAVREFRDAGLRAATATFFGYGCLSAVCMAFAILLLTGIAVATGITTQPTKTEELRALGANSSIEGHSYFLGGGSIEGKRVLNYIVQRDGYSTLEQVDADSSRIFEDEAGQPYLETVFFITSNRWVVPWAAWTRWRYDFHIPADSILEGYTIDNAAG